MALGDGIRRDVQTISDGERQRLRDAFVKLDTTKSSGDGVSYWDKQEEIHKDAHSGGSDVHSGSAFVPWHREIVNRLEGLLREVDPDLSLHYWDWTKDPRGGAGRADLFTPDFMGSPNGNAGPPFGNFESTEPGHTLIWRDLVTGSPAAAGLPNFKSDADMLAAGNAGSQASQYPAFSSALQDYHNDIHSQYIRGTTGAPHFSFHDPFVFLLHSNVDRLWAMWQTQAGQTWRLDPNQVYGTDGTSGSILDLVEPWAGNAANPSLALRPWAPPENQQVSKTYKHLSIIAPPCYDTLPTVFHIVEVANAGGAINFIDVPEGETTARAAVFRIYACSDVTLRVKAGAGPAAPYSVIYPASGSTVAHNALRPYVEARIWFGFTGTVAGAVAPPGSVTIECVENGQEFTFALTGNTIVRPRVAVMLALDQSGSMDDPAGNTGALRIEVLREAAARFAELIPADSGAGIVRFDHDAYPIVGGPFPGLPMTRIGAGGIFDAQRAQVVGAVGAHATNTNGWTSIGDGVAAARAALAALSPADYERRALIAFTDGLENRPAWIADVAGSINQRTFAIGLGTETEVSTGALRALSNGTGGYLLLTGHLSASVDDYFRLSKYFLQILAGVTNTSIIVDPTGFIAPGQRIRVPFDVADADIDLTVLLMDDLPVIGFAIETPDGDVIDQGNAGGLGGSFERGTNMPFYRFTLPVPLNAGAHGGRWHALLELDRDGFKRNVGKLDRHPEVFGRAQAHGARYSLSASSFSNLRMEGRLEQSSLEPGAQFSLRTTLTEYGMPVERRAMVVADVSRPDGVLEQVTLAETAAGAFEASFTAGIPGTYRVLLRGSGSTTRGLPFTREQALTGAVFPGSDRPTAVPTDPADRICEWLSCLLRTDGIDRLLKQHEIDPAELESCLRSICEGERDWDVPR